MPKRLGPEDVDIVVKFGAGLHTRPPENSIADNEAAAGQNFDLDIENSNLKNRKPFDLIATAPNAGSILGGGSFRDSTGTVHAFIQAGDTVYGFDGSSFTASPTLDTVNATAKLRGHWSSQFSELDGKLLISDLSLQEPIKEWDGTTWQDITFYTAPSTPYGSSLYCKYISVENERAWYANVKEGSTKYPHLMIGSTRSDYTTISVSDRPSSSLGAGDPFFLLSPDLRAINGFVQAFGTSVISTNFGKMFKLSGSDSTDFAFSDFFPGSYASGDESVCYIGSDVIYGRPGRVEAMTDTNRFGDTAADDYTKPIQDQVKTYTGWTAVYNSRLNRVYLFPDSTSTCWVFDTVAAKGDMSPWMPWETQHAMAFQPTFVQSMLDPGDGLEYVFMGDSSGNLYRLEGTGSSGDGGTSTIQTQWTSKLFALSSSAVGGKVEGYVQYRAGDNVSITVNLLYAGENVLDKGVSIIIPQAAASYFGGAVYFGGAYYFGRSYRDRMFRKRIEIDGGDTNMFQVQVSAESNSDFQINEIGLRFSANTS